MERRIWLVVMQLCLCVVAFFVLGRSGPPVVAEIAYRIGRVVCCVTPYVVGIII